MSIKGARALSVQSAIVLNSSHQLSWSQKQSYKILFIYLTRLIIPTYKHILTKTGQKLFIDRTTSTTTKIDSRILKIINVFDMSCGRYANCLSGFPCGHMPASSPAQTPNTAQSSAQVDEMTSRDIADALGQALENLDRSTVSQQVPALRLVSPKIYLNGQSIPVNVRILLTRAMERRAARIRTHGRRFPLRKRQVQQDPRFLQVPRFRGRASAKASHPAAVRKSTRVHGEKVPQSLPELLANLLSKLPLQNAPRFMQREVLRLSEVGFHTLGTLSAQEAAELRVSLRGPYDALAYLVKHDPDTPFWDDIETTLTSLPRQTFDTLARALKVVFECQVLVSKQMDLESSAKDLLATITKVPEGATERSEALDLFYTLEALDFISGLAANAETADEQ